MLSCAVPLRPAFFVAPHPCVDEYLFLSVFPIDSNWCSYGYTVHCIFNLLPSLLPSKLYEQITFEITCRLAGRLIAIVAHGGFKQERQPYRIRMVGVDQVARAVVALVVSLGQV
jgi:hypothetical protein